MFRDFDSRKLVIISASILMLMGFRWLMKVKSPQHFSEQTAGYSYEMPRVSSYGNEFDLSGREIDRQIMSDEEKKEEAKVLGNKDAKKDDKKDSKKKDDKKQSKKKDDKNKKKSFSTEVVDTRNNQNAMNSDPFAQTEQEIAQVINQQQQFENAVATDKPTAKSSKEEKEKKLSAQDWKELLLKNPTPENISLILKAHSDNKISDADFYDIALSMFKDTNSSVSDAGLAILKQDQSRSGFEYLAKEYATVNQQQRTALWKVMLGFALPNRISALNQALLSQDQGIVQMGLQVLKYAVDDQFRRNSNQGENGRTLAVTGPGSFNMFLNVLTVLSSQQNQNSELARLILNDIKTLLKK